MRKDPLLKIAVVAALCIGLVTASPSLAQQQPEYQVPDNQSPTYQTPAEENAPSTGGGETPTAPGSGAGPGNAGARPGATLPRTGFDGAIFFAVLGFVLLLAGAAIRRPLRRQ
jgi:LPXTG-motif cell wall-anchored protein